MHKNISFLFLTIITIACGCSDTQNTAEKTLDPQPATPTSAQNRNQAESLRSAQASAFEQDLNQLAELANAAEGKHEFADAAKIWGQLQQLMAERFGENAWQSRNAELAYQLAYAKSQFSAEQLQFVKRIENLQAAAAQNLQADDLQRAYSATRQLAELQKQLFGADSFAYGQAIAQVAILESELGEFEASIGNFNDAMQVFDTFALNDHPERILIHSGLAGAYSKLKKLNTAAANQKEATRIAGVVWGKQSLPFASQANQLAAIYHQAGNLKVALDIFERTLALREKLLGSEHSAVGHTCLNLGVVLLDSRRVEAASQYLIRANQIFMKQSGATAPITLRCQDRLATTFMLMQKPEQAEPWLAGIIRAMAKENAPDADAMLTYQYRLAIAQARQGKYKTAEPLLQSVLNFQQQKYGDQDARTIASLQAYAMLLDRTHRPDAAKPIRQRLERVAHLLDRNDFQSR